MAMGEDSDCPATRRGAVTTRAMTNTLLYRRRVATRRVMAATLTSA